MSRPGHNNMNQAKNPEYRNSRVDIAVEQCGADIIFPPAIFCEAWTENIQLKQLIDYAYLWVPILGVQGPCWVPMPWKIGSLSGPYIFQGSAAMIEKETQVHQ